MDEPEAAGRAVPSRGATADAPARLQPWVTDPLLAPSHVAAFDYTGANFDEITLARGDPIFVSEIWPDGWFYGYNILSRKDGLFPGNFAVTAAVAAKAAAAPKAAEAPAEGVEYGEAQAFGSSDAPTADGDDAVAYCEAPSHIEPEDAALMHLKENTPL